MQKTTLSYNIQKEIVENKTLSQIELAKKHNTTIWVIQRTIRELNLPTRGYKKAASPTIPPEAQKKEFFNYDVYSSGHVFNRDTNKWIAFNKRRNIKLVRGKEYVENVGKRSNLTINNDGVKKIISISLANLIGILFVPNPQKHKYIHFKEGGRNNCDYKNLYWSNLHFRNGRIKIMPQKLRKVYLGIDYEKLSRFDKPVYSWVVQKNSEPLMNLLKEEKKYFIACMTDEWKRSCPEEKPNRTIIIDVHDLFVAEGVMSLIDRGFYVPSAKYYPDDKRFLFYCRNNLMGGIKHYLYRERPKQRKLNELYLPSERGKLVSRQHHKFD